MKMVVLSQQEIPNGVRHDEFKESGLPDGGSSIVEKEEVNCDR